MRYLSLCSGIEAASVAWHDLGWTPVGFSEIEPFPAAVLAHRFPTVKNYGDMTKYENWDYAGMGTIDLVAAGTPCQSFSTAGLRQGLKDPRGNLMLTYLSIVERVKPKWIVWENVPGVLSSGGGRDFGTFLGALGQLGYGWAYRVLDAQYMRVGRWPKAVPQRRRRVFVVGYLGDWRASAEVLAIREGVQGHIEARRASREAAESDIAGGVRGGCWPAKIDGAPLFVPEVIGALMAKGPQGQGVTILNAQQYLAYWWDGSDCAPTLTRSNAGGSQRMPDQGNLGAVLQPVCVTGDRTHTLTTADGVTENGSGRGTPIVAIGTDCYNGAITGDVAATLGMPGSSVNASGPTVAVATHENPASGYGMAVRRLTPRECERLQGFPDDWTLIPWRGKAAEQCPDSPRYKALGNSMACNCMAWIGERIQRYNDKQQREAQP